MFEQHHNLVYYYLIILLLAEKQFELSYLIQLTLAIPLLSVLWNLTDAFKYHYSPGLPLRPFSNSWMRTSPLSGPV